MLLFIQKRQRYAQQQRGQRLNLRRTARREKALRQNHAQRQQNFRTPAQLMAIRRIGGKHRQREEADDAQQLEHIQIINRSPRYGIQHGQRRRGEVQRRFRRQRGSVHLTHERKHLLDEQARFLIDSQQQNDQSGGQQNLPNRQPDKALSVKRGLHQQHRRVRRRRHDDKQRTVAPSSDIVEVAQRSGGNVIQGQRTCQQRG